MKDCERLFGVENAEDKCQYLNPGLVVEKCLENEERYDGKCYLKCPEGFEKKDEEGELIVNPLICFKPEVKVGLRGECEGHFDYIAGFCIPKCPIKFIDRGVFCEKPEGREYKEFFHKSFMRKTVEGSEI